MLVPLLAWHPGSCFVRIQRSQSPLKRHWPLGIITSGKDRNFRSLRTPSRQTLRFPEPLTGPLSCKILQQLWYAWSMNLVANEPALFTCCTKTLPDDRTMVQHSIHIDLHAGSLTALHHGCESFFISRTRCEVVGHGLVAGPPGAALNMLLGWLEVGPDGARARVDKRLLGNQDKEAS